MRAHAGLALSQRTARLAGVDADKLWDAGLFAILSAFLLSRLLLIAAHLHTFLQYPVLLLTVPSLTATGLLFTAIATFLWLYFKRIPLLPALDAWAPCATLVWAFLAIGHFCDGSDPGMPTTLCLSVTLRGDDFAQHPVALYAAAAALALTPAAALRVAPAPCPRRHLRARPRLHWPRAVPIELSAPACSRNHGRP